MQMFQSLPPVMHVHLAPTPTPRLHQASHTVFSALLDPTPALPVAKTAHCVQQENTPTTSVELPMSLCACHVLQALIQTNLVPMALTCAPNVRLDITQMQVEQQAHPHARDALLGLTQTQVDWAAKPCVCHAWQENIPTKLLLPMNQFASCVKLDFFQTLQALHAKDAPWATLQIHQAPVHASCVCLAPMPMLQDFQAVGSVPGTRI